VRLHDILQEGIVVHGDALLAYTITVAEIYAEKPVFEPSAVRHWEALVASNDKMFRRVIANIDIVFTEDDPYKNVREVVQDVVNNRRLKVFKTPESKHPFFSERDNDMFRALHDALTHVGSNITHFIRMVKADPRNAKKFKPIWGSGFSVRGEMNTFVTHSRIAPREATPALFTEIVGQICTYFVTGDFADDKVAVLDGVDFKNVGVLSGKRAARYQELLAQIEDPSIRYTRTKVNNITIDKEKINWRMLSPGEGATHRR
jgi:hypothetical protein